MDTLLAILSESDGIALDSRDKMTNRVFFAMRNKNHNSHKFALHALSKGALCAVVDDQKILKKASPEYLKRLFFVDDISSTLEEIKKHYKEPFIDHTQANR